MSDALCTQCSICKVDTATNNQTADAALKTSIDALNSVSKTADTILTTSIDALNSTDVKLTPTICAIDAAYKDADSALASTICALSTACLSSEATLAYAINAEKLRSDVNATSTALSDEISARKTADATLTTSVQLISTNLQANEDDTAVFTYRVGGAILPDHLHYVAVTRKDISDAISAYDGILTEYTFKKISTTVKSHKHTVSFKFNYLNNLVSVTDVSSDGSHLHQAISIKDEIITGFNIVSGTGTENLSGGFQSLISNTTGDGNTAIGYQVLFCNTKGGWNTAIGRMALYSNTTGSENIATGDCALYCNTTGYENTAYGMYVLGNNETGYCNTAMGYYASYNNTTGNCNTAMGQFALGQNKNGSSNTAFGNFALVNNQANFNTAFGDNALAGNIIHTNVSGFGQNAQITGNNQIQMGDSATTLWCYGAVNNRSDIRDKADVRDTILGLDFINKLRPVDYKWDYREDYKPPRPIDKIIPKNATDEEKKSITAENKAAVDNWLESIKLRNLKHDGTHKRTRFHHGLIAQEVQSLITETGIDFGGFKDVSYDGTGDDVLGIGYEELIAPMIKAIQQLTESNADLTKRILVLEQKNNSIF